MLAVALLGGKALLQGQFVGRRPKILPLVLYLVFTFAAIDSIMHSSYSYLNIFLLKGFLSGSLSFGCLGR